MNSSIHSSVSTSSDVAILPSINNHINHNHTESTNKSLKRSRSPSLILDDNNDTNHSLTNPDTPTKKSRKRRTTTDIDQSLGLVKNFLYSSLLCNIKFSLDDIYLPINYMSIDGQQMNHMQIYMFYKNKYVIIYHLNHLNENIQVEKNNNKESFYYRNFFCRYLSTNC